MMRSVKPVVYLALAFAAGIVLGRQGFFNLPNALLLSSGLFMLTILLGKRKSGVVIILLLVVSLGIFWCRVRSVSAPDDISKIPYFERSGLREIKGIVVSDVEYRPFFSTEKTVFTLRLIEIGTKYGPKPVSGTVLVNIFRHTPFRYGDLVRLTGRFHPPFVKEESEPYTYRDFLAIRGIEYIFSIKSSGLVERIECCRGRWIQQRSFQLRNRWKNVFDDYLTRNESGIMKAVILGDRSHVPDHVKELFLRTGTAHILAISGLHVGIVAGLIILICRFFPLSRRFYLLTTIVLLLAYCFLTGGRPSVMRATIMIVVVLLSFVLEKEPQPLNTLALAAFIILLTNPMYLFDVGFQLSFACMMAIFIVYPVFRQGTLRSGKPQVKVPRWNKLIKDSFFYSVSIWFGVAGVIAYYFNIITPVSILANLLIVPVIGIVVALGVLLLALASFSVFLSAAAAGSLKLVLNGMVAAVFLFDQLPYTHYFIKSVSAWQLGIYYFLLCLLLIVLCRIDKAPQV